jgi:hypothetical protein
VTERVEVRHVVVARLIEIMLDPALPIEARVELIATDAEARYEEKTYAAVMLAGTASQALKECTAVREVSPKSLLDMTYREVQAIVRRGIALAYMLDRWGLPHWASRPDTPLVDVLKTMSPANIEDVAKVLRAVGIHDLDQGGDAS